MVVGRGMVTDFSTVVGWGMVVGRGIRVGLTFEEFAMLTVSILGAKLEVNLSTTVFPISVLCLIFYNSSSA